MDPRPPHRECWSWTTSPRSGTPRADCWSGAATRWWQRPVVPRAHWMPSSASPPRRCSWTSDWATTTASTSVAGSRVPARGSRCCSPRRASTSSAMSWWHPAAPAASSARGSFWTLTSGVLAARRGLAPAGGHRRPEPESHSRVPTSNEQPLAPRTVEIVVSIPTVVKAAGGLLRAGRRVLRAGCAAVDRACRSSRARARSAGQRVVAAWLGSRESGPGRVRGDPVRASVIVIWAAKPVWNEVTEFVDEHPGLNRQGAAQRRPGGRRQGTDAFEKLESVAAEAAKNLPEAAVNLLGAAPARSATSSPS